MDLWEVMSQFKSSLLCLLSYLWFAFPFQTPGQLRSSSAPLLPSALPHPGREVSCQNWLSIAVFGEWTLQRAQQELGAGTWHRLGGLSGPDLLLWLVRAGSWTQQLTKPQPLWFHIFHLYRRLKDCFQIKQLVIYSYFKKYCRTNIMRRRNLPK